MPLIPHSDQGLAWKIHERLWKFAKGKLSESEFEEFLTDKLEAAEKNLETLETNEYPDVAADHHAVLHSAFVGYLDSLLALEEFLWGENSEQEVSSTLGDVMRLFLEADKLILRFESGMQEDFDQVSSLGRTW